MYAPCVARLLGAFSGSGFSTIDLILNTFPETSSISAMPYLLRSSFLSILIPEITIPPYFSCTSIICLSLGGVE